MSFSFALARLFVLVLLQIRRRIAAPRTAPRTLFPELVLPPLRLDAYPEEMA